MAELLDDSSKQRRPSRFRFGMRTLACALTLLCVMFAVLAARITWVREQNAKADRIMLLGGTLSGKDEPDGQWSARLRASYLVPKHEGHEELTLSGQDVTMEHVHAIRDLPDIESVLLYHSTVPPDVLPSLFSQSNIRHFFVGDSEVGWQGLCKVRHSPVDAITVRQSGLKANDLKCIGRCYNLVEIVLIGEDLGSATIDDLSSLRRLRYLQLVGCSWDRGFFDGIASLTSLEKLILWGSNVQNEDMRTISQSASIESLFLPQTGIGDEGVRHLEGLVRLKELNLSSTRISNRALDSIRRMPALKEVSVGGTAVSPNGIERLQAHRPDLVISGRSNTYGKDP